MKLSEAKNCNQFNNTGSNCISEFHIMSVFGPEMLLYITKCYEETIDAISLSVFWKNLALTFLL